MMWDMGLRVQAAKRISPIAASLSRVTVNGSEASAPTLLLSDFYLSAQEVYGRFASTGKNYESRGGGGGSTSLEFSIRCDMRRIAMWRTCFGPERKDERTKSMPLLVEMHEAHPDLFAIPIIVSAWRKWRPGSSME